MVSLVKLEGFRVAQHENKPLRHMVFARSIFRICLHVKQRNFRYAY